MKKAIDSCVSKEVNAEIIAINNNLADDSKTTINEISKNCRDYHL